MTVQLSSPAGLLQPVPYHHVAVATGTAAASAAILPPVLIAVAILAGIHWLNRIAARRLSAAIAALDAAS